MTRHGFKVTIEQPRSGTVCGYLTKIGYGYIPLHSCNGLIICHANFLPSSGKAIASFSRTVVAHIVPPRAAPAERRRAVAAPAAAASGADGLLDRPDDGADVKGAPTRLAHQSLPSSRLVFILPHVTAAAKSKTTL